MYIYSPYTLVCIQSKQLIKSSVQLTSPRKPVGLSVYTMSEIYKLGSQSVIIQVSMVTPVNIQV